MRQPRARPGLNNKFYLLLEATSFRLGEMYVLCDVQKANRESKNKERKNRFQMKLQEISSEKTLRNEGDLPY